MVCLCSALEVHLHQMPLFGPPEKLSGSGTYKIWVLICFPGLQSPAQVKAAVERDRVAKRIKSVEQQIQTHQAKEKERKRNIAQLQQQLEALNAGQLPVLVTLDCSQLLLPISSYFCHNVMILLMLFEARLFGLQLKKSGGAGSKGRASC